MTIEFFGTEDVVYAGPRRKLVLTEGVASQERSVAPVLKITDGDLLVGLMVYENDKAPPMHAPQWLFRVHNDDIDLIALWRGLNVLGKEKTLTPDTLRLDLIAMESEADPDAVKQLVDRIGQEAFNSASTEPVPGLPAAIHYLQSFQPFDFTVNKATITDAVRNGTLVYSAALAAAGVESPADEDARLRQQDEVAAPYMPHLVAWLQAMGYRDGCKCPGRLKQVAAEVVGKNFTDPAIVTGLSIAIASARYGIAVITGHGGTLEIEMSNSPTVRPLMTSWLVQRFESAKAPRDRRDIGYYLNTLQSILKDWDNLPSK